MPDKDNKILKYNPGEQSLKVPFISCGDLECLFQKINACQNNPEKSYTEKKAEHIPSSYSYLHVVHLINLKMNKNVIEEKTV